MPLRPGPTTLVAGGWRPDSRPSVRSYNSAMRRGLSIACLQMENQPPGKRPPGERGKVGLGEVSYPFPRLRAGHVTQTYRRVYGRHDSLSRLLEEHVSAGEIRRRLIHLAVGIGPKQASLFLRNTGHSNDLAVLDTHVLRYMLWMGLRDHGASVPRGVPDYENAEAVLRSHADDAGYSLGCFDYAVWVVMRALRSGGWRVQCES